MVKKAKLDILEIAPEEPGGETKQNEATAEQGRGGGSSEEQTGGYFLSKALGWLRRPLFWMLLMSVVFLGLMAGVLISYYQYLDEDAPSIKEKQAVSATPFPEAKPGALFEGIVVDQGDVKGHIRILFCDVALKLENHKPAAINGDRIDVRGVIYAVLKKEPAQEGLTPEGRGRLKEKLKNQLNGLFGADLVKDVYFTRYELD